MRKYLVAILLLLVVVLSGCSSDDKDNEQKPTIVFKGKGSDWEATYKYYKVSNNAYDYELTLFYNGNITDLVDNYDQMTMEYGVGTNRMSGTYPIKSLNMKNLMFKNSGSIEGVNLLSDDSKIDLYIKWGENIDSFILTKEK